MSRRKLGLFLLWLLACAPALALVALIARHSVDLPYADEWDTPGVAVHALAEGRLSWGHLVAQHNENRMLVPRLVSLALLSEGHWDVRAAMWASALTAALTSLGLAWLAHRELGLRGARLALAVLLANMALFNPSQAWNWLFGIQIAFFLPFLFLIACLICAALPVALPWRVGGAMLLCGLSTFTMSAGVASWLLCAPWLFVTAWQTLRGRPNAIRTLTLWMVGWGCALIACLAYYLRGYQKPSHHPDLAAVLDQPLEAVRFLLEFLSGPMGPRPPEAPGLIGVATLLALAVLSWMGRGAGLRRQLLLWTLPAASLAVGAMVLVGRLGFGPEAALVERYATFGVPLYVGLSWAAARSLGTRSRASPLERAFRVVAWLTLVILYVGAAVVAGAHGMERMRRIERERRLERAALFLVDQMEVDDQLRWAVPEARHLLLAHELDRLGLLAPGIAHGRHWTRESSASDSDRHGRVDSLEARTVGGRTVVSVHGWAFLPERWRTPDGVVVGVRDRDSAEWQPVDLVPVHLPRPDVAAQRGKAYRRTGWQAVVHCRRVRPGSEMAAWAFDAEGAALLPLVGLFGLSEEACRESLTTIPVEQGVLRRARSLRHPGWILAGEGVEVGAGGRLNLHADRGVLLSNGFRVASGGWLRLQSPYYEPPRLPEAE